MNNMYNNRKSNDNIVRRMLSGILKTIAAAFLILGVVSLLANHNSKKKTATGDMADPTAYYTTRMNEAIDTLLAAHFMTGTEMTGAGKVEEISRREAFSSEIEALQVRLSVYSSVPEEMMTEQMRQKVAGIRESIDSLEREAQTLGQERSSSMDRIRRIYVMQPDGDRFTAFQRIDGACTASELFNILQLD